MRKFFATELIKADISPLYIDFLSGRTIDKTREAYFKSSPEHLKRIYMGFMKNLMITEDIEYKVLSSKEKMELEELRKDKLEKDKRISEIERLLKEVTGRDYP